MPKKNTSASSLIPGERIERAILLIRGQKVLLDSDLAELYGVETKALNQAVKRNLARFPADFMFRLNRHETRELNRSQIVTGSQKHRDPRFPPYAFSEQGVAMLSSVLRSERAVAVNIEIMRAFVRVRVSRIGEAAYDPSNGTCAFLAEGHHHRSLGQRPRTWKNFDRLAEGHIHPASMVEVSMAFSQNGRTTPRSWGVAPGYGGSRPSAKHGRIAKHTTSKTRAAQIADDYKVRALAENRVPQFLDEAKKPGN